MDAGLFPLFFQCLPLFLIPRLTQALLSFPHRCNRPTLEQIAAHPFFTHNTAMIPKSVPLSGTHIAPDWQEDPNGKIYAVEKASDEKYRRPTISSRRKKSAAESTSAVTAAPSADLKAASTSGRHALASKNPNSDSTAATAANAKSSGAVGSETKQQPVSSSSKFNIFEEGKDSERKASGGGHHENPPQADLFSPSINGQATAANTATASSSPTSSSADKDMHALEVMHNRLQNAFDAAGAIASLQRSKSPAGRAEQPDIWVTRYVDYTSKYGLGFLLNDGR